MTAEAERRDVKEGEDVEDKKDDERKWEEDRGNPTCRKGVFLRESVEVGKNGQICPPVANRRNTS